MLAVSTFDPPKEEPLLRWIAQNEKFIEGGSASYEGQRVTLNSLVTRYNCVCSFIFFTARTCSPYVLVDSDKATTMAWRYNLMTFLFGWWSIFGLAYTPIALYKNMVGKEQRRVAEVLYEIHHPEIAAKRRNQ